MEILLTAFATIIGGSLTFALGQLILDGTVKPALELKRRIGTIAYDLQFYGTNDLYKSEEVQTEWRTRHRKHAAELLEKLNLVLWHSGFEKLLRLPSDTEIIEASRELIFESNRSSTIEGGWTPSRADNIKKLLHIRPYYS